MWTLSDFRAVYRYEKWFTRTLIFYPYILYPDPPKNTSILARPSSVVDAGRPLTLTCASQACPAVDNFTWYRLPVDGGDARCQNLFDFLFMLMLTKADRLSPARFIQNCEADFFSSILTESSMGHGVWSCLHLLRGRSWWDRSVLLWGQESDRSQQVSGADRQSQRYPHIWMFHHFSNTNLIISSIFFV